MIGIRAHDVGKMPVRDLAREIARRGFRCTHLALHKAITDYDFSLGKLNPGMAREIREAFYKENVYISVLGCYINPVHPDEKIRREQLERFKEHIRFARDFGCSIVATETGSLNADFSYTPENSSPKAFEMIVNSVAELVEEAEKFGVIVCIEGVTTHTVSSPKIMKKVLDEIKSNNLQVLFDPVNLLDANNIDNQREMISEAFELFGDRILVIHAKDLIIENNVKRTVPVGKGLLDFQFLFKHIKARKPGIDILIEDLKPEAMEYSRSFIERLLEE
ncbi:xylose isomerase domain-containing protein [Thermoclostridium stercorarium subsp. stercorarium DSM 8532]|jgi:L-ribulose-5-phosphate 3-epimerase|uniref:Xylose isomerase domain-containing protein n=3 Tax=Thermoclostridium stercorarium TaxID=1510 RepID=L7VMR3_THES1|nr:sugar phosphate isomerase/epimerase family protein [Thermoclostridium stercorarium]AGC67944.1 xylose isomerase domain-containing protein [Thermoclostridium stercorarium subsp. stercorarium DSM 8532]AGI38980.1 sugar phosphate isomerase [Thermoclostridium stercorarium subsp. stercorarium DSM 8532]ANW98348.1 AP endonuclease [Thermoclostridium stercorarium subsp. thermolacticum DSM 2910]ANX00875.1 AP endonuclease [Thermoclostridium stercorarium subsp. leptospartum DSM 9219]UZQ86489.1 sugar phos